MSERSERSSPAVHPVVVLVVIALVPAVALFGVWRWAAGRAAGSDPPPDVTAAAPNPSPALATPLLSWRRMPVALAADANRAGLDAALDLVDGMLNDTSCLAVSLDGSIVAEAAADRALIPASNQKLIVAAVALEVLGPEHRFTTEVRAEVSEEGVVTGDLFLVGGGDPVLVSAAYPNENDVFPAFNTTSLDDLAAAVADAGVTRVVGDVVGDGSRYDDEWYVPSWPDDVRAIEGGPYDALLVNDARVTGDPLRAADPALGAARELAMLLVEQGIDVRGRPAIGTASDGADVVASARSQPLADVVAEMLTTSDNNTAEMLVKEVGSVAGDGGTREAGLEVMSAALAEWGLLADDGSDEVVLADGSGLSSDNRVTCRLLLGVLDRTSIDAPLGAGLPVAGESGTMADVFADSAVTGRLRAKTGTLVNPPLDADPPAVKALSGYLPTGGHGTISFALVLNGPGPLTDQSSYRPVWNEVVDALTSYPAVARDAAVAPR